MNRNTTLARVLLVSLVSVFSVNAVASGPGFLLGFMLGPARTAKPKEGSTSTNSRSQIGVRLYMGYKFNHYVGMESGLTYFSTVNKNQSGTPPSTGAKSRGSFDILGKGIIPFSSRFDAFGKLGIAATTSSKTGAINPNIGGTCSQTIGSITFCPTVSVGGAWNLNQSVAVDLTLSRILFSGTSSVKYQDFYSLGISYHFVDLYCGQFLC